MMNTGCSYFSGRATEQEPWTVEVKLTVAQQVNPDAADNPQPVRICIIETRRAGWLPQQLYEGRICEGLSASADVVNFEQYILAPGQTKTYKTINQDYDSGSRWVIVGAEFQRGIGKYSLIERHIPPDGDFKIDVVAENTSLTFL
ncbi:hypothetical protein NG42_16130 [Winslowiella iniecta]|uniref:Uncharacterized protein n=2 Tax=Winslowiella iniecta TaxID=1560201 RepID=A0A0L7T5C5_9GAMM|nr:hypothetical protein NG42_16130 [Winslowiella iniecta]KOC90548.1 hypothetical protein NG43_16860 [Winslowiella iniecta]